MRQLASRYPSLSNSIETCHQIIDEQACLIREYRQQGMELTELVSEFADQISNQSSVNERTMHYVDHISHEFRTPLSVILDYLTILDQGFAGSLSSEQRLLLDTIAVHANELSGMVDDILDVRRIDAGVLAMNRAPVSVKQVVERAQAVLVQKAKPRKVKLEVELDDSLPSVFADAEKVGRVVLNLGMNAIKFCGSPGVVSISASTVGDQVQINVRDNGCGIDAKDCTRIFERFEQLESSSWSSTRGFGLGLVIAKELVELNFGSIGVESSSNGTEFWFTIPLADLQTIVQCYTDYMLVHHSEVRMVEAFRLCPRANLEAGDVEKFICRSLHASEMLVPIHNGWLLFSKPAIVRRTIDRIHSLLDRQMSPDGTTAQIDLAVSPVFSGCIDDLPNQLSAKVGRRSDHRAVAAKFDSPSERNWRM